MVLTTASTLANLDLYGIRNDILNGWAKFVDGLGKVQWTRRGKYGLSTILKVVSINRIWERLCDK